MKISIFKLTLAALFAVVLAAAVSVDPSSSRAGYYGDSPWCAVVDEGAGEMQWQCEYDSQEDCMPAILQGNRGFCARNPYYRKN